jgi:outer membrane protein
MRSFRQLGLGIVSNSMTLVLLTAGAIAQTSPEDPESVPFFENGQDPVTPQISPTAPPVQPMPIESESMPAEIEASPDHADPNAIESELPSTATNQAINLTLPNLLNLTLQGNRTLRDRTLERIIQRQQLNEAEQAFDPRFTPALRVDVTRNLSASGNNVVNTEDGLIILSDATDVNQQALLTTDLDTRIGTNLRIGLDPLEDTQPFEFRITQPLMRGFGQAVNEAPVDQARLQENQNQLELRSTVIETLTLAITRYTSLISAQRQVEIQADALARRQEQLKIQQALVAAGRQARVDLFDVERSVADAERDLVVAQNSLQQANSNILNLIGTDRNLTFTASIETVAQLYESAVARASTYEQERLVQLALQHRPDYLRAQLERRRLELEQLVAEDNLRWSLDAVADSNLGNFSQTTVGLVATRTFDEPQLQTARVSSDVNLERQDNRLTQLEEQIRNDVTSDLADVQSNLLRVQAAERATVNATLQLEAAEAQFRLGRGNVTLFQIITQEDQLVTAQSNELEARIDFLNSVAQLEQTVGITLESWGNQINLQPLSDDMGHFPDLSPVNSENESP